MVGGASGRPPFFLPKWQLIKEDIKRLKSIQLELHADFIKVVENSRGTKIKEPEKNNIFTGEFWTGAAALKLGLIDGIGNVDQVLKEK